VKKQLDSYFTKEGIDATVMDWQESAGAIGTLSSAVKIVFNVLVLIIAIVAIIIIIMNTIVISVTERVPEIGTMRAVGAKKGFIFRLILTEVMIIVLVFGLIGIGLGASLLVVLNLPGSRLRTCSSRLFSGARCFILFSPVRQWLWRSL
jgi:ABC-type antimicrobial peptide transport system permease subunit